jgi:hypothetical protein
MFTAIREEQDSKMSRICRIALADKSGSFASGGWSGCVAPSLDDRFRQFGK